MAVPSMRPRPLVTSFSMEAEAAPGQSSMALVKVDKENTMATAGVLAGVAGVLVGGVWLGGALFAATSYLVRKDDDLSKGLSGVATGSLEALNFVDYLSNKYEVTSKLGSALSQGPLESVSDAITNFDKEVGIKDSLGGILLSGTDLAAQAVAKAMELNEEYRVTDQIKEKIDSALSK
ncbi:unnamed protein product [Polarella glacialis]|uniref:Uncharacterized protein n=1 Tax=Polarella glacialis TaxID=89957 RepID=A0A813FF04_POLGL|nr:unnamed protein product [Polarella glacialis]